MSQLEDELHAAARLGKELLDRHDNYIKEVEQERLSFLAEIARQNAFAKMVDELESNNRALELQNQQSMQENLALLKRLEALNSSLNEADVQNEQLRITLVEAEHTLGKLSQRANKANALEKHVLDVELERELLTQDLALVSHVSVASDGRFRIAEEKNKQLERRLEDLERSKQGSDVLKPIDATSESLGMTKRTKDNPMKAIEANALDTSDKSSLEAHNAELLRVLANSQDEITFQREQLHKQHEDSLSIKDFDGEKSPRRTVSQELHRHHHYHYHLSNKTKVNKRDSRSKESFAKPSVSTKLALGPQMAEKEFKTPIRASCNNGLYSPPTTATDRRHRDSGYFSFASEDSTRARSNSLKQPMSYAECPLDEPLDASTPVKAHYKSNSYDSVFNPQDLVLPLNEEIAQSLQDSDLPMPSLRHSTSHESVFEPAAPVLPPALQLSKNASMRRPYPAPLQNSTSSATVSMASATAYNAPLPGSSGDSTPRSKSYKALRSAAAAQKLSPTAQTPPLASTSQFWRRNSDKQVQSVSKTGRTASRWTSFVPRWSSQGAVATLQDLAEQNPSPTVKDARQVGESSVTTAVMLSNAEEELLREALAL